MHSGKILRKVWFSVRRPAAAEKSLVLALEIRVQVRSSLVLTLNLKIGNDEWQHLWEKSIPVLMSLFALKKSLDSTFHGHHQSISSKSWLCFSWTVRVVNVTANDGYVWNGHHTTLKQPRWNHFLDAITCKVTVRSTWHHKIEDISYVIWATWSLILPHFKTRFAHSFPLTEFRRWI